MVVVMTITVMVVVVVMAAFMTVSALMEQEGEDTEKAKLGVHVNSHRLFTSRPHKTMARHFGPSPDPKMFSPALHSALKLKQHRVHNNIRLQFHTKFINTVFGYLLAYLFIYLFF